jgi:hypothetical protein
MKIKLELDTGKELELTVGELNELKTLLTDFPTVSVPWTWAEPEINPFWDGDFPVISYYDSAGNKIITNCTTDHKYSFCI